MPQRKKVGKVKKFKNAKVFLDYLNATFSKLHTAYETRFWTSYMGDHSVDAVKSKAEYARDEFRSNTKLAEIVDEFITKEKGEIKTKLQSWKHFFSLYQMPPEALEIKQKAAALEDKIAKYKTTRKEGYVDPKTNQFIEASENKMRTLVRTHDDEATRKAVFEALEKMSLECADDFVELVKVRNAAARAMGHDDFYAYKARIDEDMTKDELFSIFEKIYEKTKFAFDKVRALELSMPGLRKPWNFGYMMTGDFVKEEDPYFQFEDVLSIWGRSFYSLGLDFMGGTLRLDLLDRAGKYNNGFCHYPSVVMYKEGKRIPGSAGFTCNAVLGQVGSGIQAVNTLFHEGGHAADRLNSIQTETCLNHEYPPNTVSWAETQSMFMDSISDSIEWRTRYAKNSSGETYPYELYERKLRKVHPILPLDMMHIYFVMLFERMVYEHKDLTRDALIQISKEVYRICFDRDGDSTSILNLPHIYSWESSAYYHGYGLAELGVYQWRAYFYKKYGYIVDNPKVGKELTKIWGYASLYPAKKLIVMATGKKLSPDDYLNEITAPLTSILKKTSARVERMKKVPLSTKPIKFNAKIMMMHGKKIIADNSKGFDAMDKKYRAWLATMKKM